LYPITNHEGPEGALNVGWMVNIMTLSLYSGGKISSAHCIGVWVSGSRFGRLRKPSTSSEFDHRAVHSLASRCTDCDVRALLLLDVRKQMFFSKRIPTDDIKVLNLPDGNP